jgi:class 3 adenylate cyclase
VSVLFCDLVGFTSRAEQLDVEDVREVLRPYYTRLRAELERYGGTVEKFIGDAVMALFGAPVAREDDPGRAVRAALTIREAIAELNQADPTLDLHVRIGVTTGEALIALDARPVEGEGMASGDVVNTAARLQAAAPVDGVLVDQATYWPTNRRTGRTWRRDAGQVPLPETVQGIIAARLDALGPGEKALLADAAVLGTVSWLGALAKLGGTQPLSLQPGLRLLEGREFLREERHSAVAGERPFSFRHVLVREVVYAQLPRGQRAGKHQKAAEWIESLSPERAEDRAELLAHHYLAAVAYARAARQDTAALAERTKVACGNTGDRALELNAFSAASRWYAAALDDLDPDDPARPRLLFRLGQARFHAEQAGGEQLADSTTSARAW